MRSTSLSIPLVVQALCEELARRSGQVHTPLAWLVNDRAVTIVFEDGRKLVFERQPAPTAPAARPPRRSASARRPA